jgi:hypothetical protein
MYMFRLRSVCEPWHKMCPKFANDVIRTHPAIDQTLDVSAVELLMVMNLLGEAMNLICVPHRPSNRQSPLPMFEFTVPYPVLDSMSATLALLPVLPHGPSFIGQ